MNSTWLNGFVATTGFKYMVAMLATYAASKIGIDHGTIEAILTQLIGVAMLIWGAWESKRNKVVMQGTKVSVKELSPSLQADIKTEIENITDKVLAPLPRE